MANNYTLFSVSLGQLTDAEREWLRAEYAKTHDDVIIDPNSAYGEEIDNPDYDQEAGTFDMELNPDEVIIYSEECGNGDAAADLIQAWLKKFHPKKWLVLEIVNSCSRARPGEFGGAVCLVTAKKQRWMNTGTWADQQAKRLKLNRKQRVF